MVVLSLATLVLSGTACSSQANAEGDKQNAGAAAAPIKIGISQQLEHQSLDDIHRGIVDAFQEKGYIDGDTIVIDYQNAQNDQSNLKTISQRFVNNESDIIIAIGTGPAQSAAIETQDIPIVAAAVTDMVSAELVNSIDIPGGNITGISDITPIQEQLDLLVKLSPDAKKIGLAYCSSEINSEVQAKLAKEYIESLGLECITATVVSTNDILQNLSALAEKVDALYIPVDNTLASAMPTVMSLCEPKKLPVIVGAAPMAQEGALGSVAFDYYDVGRQSGEMAIRILNGEDPAVTPVETVKETGLYLNKSYADTIGISIPDELLDKAKQIY